MDTFWCTSRASSRHGHINLFSWWIGLDLVQDALCIWVFLFTYMLFNIYLFYLMCHLWLAYLWYLQHFHHVALFLKSWQSQFYEPNKCTDALANIGCTLDSHIMYYESCLSKCHLVWLVGLMGITTSRLISV
jgi:hypothetical protein